MSPPEDAPRYRLEVVKGKDAGTVQEGGPEAPLTIGRKLDNVLVLQKDLTVSRHHAVIEPTSRGYRVRDVGSQAGVKRRGQKIPPDGFVLSDGDEIELGTTVIRFALASRSAALREEEPAPAMTDSTRLESLPPREPPAAVPVPPMQRRQPVAEGGRAERPGRPHAPARDLADEPTIESFGRFEVKRALGGGGGGERLDLAIDGRGGKEVLLRRIPASTVGWFAKKRFVRACQEAGDFEHPNLVVPLESGREGDFLYVVLPAAAGVTVEGMLRDCPRELTLELAIYVGREVAAALAYVETKRGPGFRAELTARTVTVTASGGVVLAMGVPAVTDARDTLTGRFRAPEEDGGQTGDRRAAVFAAGVLVYELLTRDAIDPAAKAALRSVDIVRFDAPPNLARAVMRAVETRPDDRYDGAAQLEEAMAEVLNELAPSYGAEDAAAWITRHFPDAGW